MEEDTKPAAKKTTAPAKLDWAASDAKAMMAQDMMDGLVPIHKEIVNKKKLFDDMYKDCEEFEDWPWDAGKYYTRIRSLQKTVREMMAAKELDEAALIHDRKIHPENSTTHYPNGKALWKGSTAAEKLKVDFDNNAHLGKSRAAFKASRACYAEFDESRITQRLDYLNQAGKEFGKTPGQDKEEKVKKKKRPKQPQYKPDKSRTASVNPFVDGAKPPRKKKKTTTTKKTTV